MCVNVVCLNLYAKDANTVLSITMKKHNFFVYAFGMYTRIRTYKYISAIDCNTYVDLNPVMDFLKRWALGCVKKKTFLEFPKSPYSFVATNEKITLQFFQTLLTTCAEA